MLVPKRLMIITGEVGFSVGIKRSLEQMGRFQVISFTTSQNALDYLSANPQDIALVDFRASGLPPADLIIRMRSIQSELAILVAPDTEEAQQLTHDLNLQGVVHIPVAARVLVPMIDEATKSVLDSLPDTAQGPAVNVETNAEIPRVEDFPLPPLNDDSSAEESQTIEFILSDDGETVEQIIENRKTQSELIQESDDALEIFQRLAAEEPPMPSLEDSGTINDLANRVSTSDLSAVAAEYSRHDEDTAETAVVDDATEDDYLEEDTPSTPVSMVLETALDNTTPLEAFSLDDLFKNLRDQLAESEAEIQPLPSWIRESERYIREPDFLTEELPTVADAGFDEGVLEDSVLFEYTATITESPQDQRIEITPEELDTDRIEPERRSRPIEADASVLDEITPPRPEMPPTLPEMPEPVDEAVFDETELDDTVIGEADEAEITSPETTVEDTVDDKEDIPSNEIEDAPAVEYQTEAEVAEETPDTPIPAVERDPYVAQLALTLTQVSLELASEATLLAKGGQVVAYAGKMSAEDIDEIRQAVNDDWEAEAEQARIRFVNLPSRGKDYMLYSRRTDGGDFTLSLIFAGTQQLRLIRQQAKKLADALEATSEVSDAPLEAPSATPHPEPATEVDLVSYTYMWLLADPKDTMVQSVRDQLQLELSTMLRQDQWQIHRLDVRGDYIYLYADVPDSQNANETMRELMQRSAEILNSIESSIDAEKVWADSYLVLKPGREIGAEEIQEFIDFARS